MLLCVGGCSTKLPEGPELKVFAEKARDEARAACETQDAKGARRAADRAKAAEEKAAKGAESAAEAEKAAADELACQVRTVAREAARFAQLAEDRQTLAKKVSSWKARGYRAARGPALKVLFTLMASGAEGIGQNYDSLTPEQKDVVDLAATLADDLKRPDGRPDWTALAARMAAWADRPPSRADALLAIAYALTARDELALIEVELLDPDGVADAREKAAYRVLRGIVYQLNGLLELGKAEFEAMAAPGSPESAAIGPEFEAGIHLCLGAFASNEKDWARADLEVMRAMKICPNNPIGILLTGEVMVAEGKYEKAAVSLEGLVRGPAGESDPWLLEKVQKRAREIRDKKGDAEPLFCNNKFICDLSLHYIWQAARTSKQGQDVKKTIDAAQSFGARFVKLLPDFGGGKTAEP
jgi:hypothetical protein